MVHIYLTDDKEFTFVQRAPALKLKPDVEA